MKRKDFITSIIPLGVTISNIAAGKIPDIEGVPIIIPPYLKMGDTIGITCPAGYITLIDIEPAVKKNKRMGLSNKNWRNGW